MRPLSITMEAFGSYADKKTVDLTVPQQNLFLITGETGSGKTTIFDAIVFALYDEASSQNNKKSGTDLQSQFTDYDRQPIVTLTFEESGGIYRVTRKAAYFYRDPQTGSFTKRSGSVTLVMPDGTEYPETGKKAVNAKLAELIGLDKSQFMQVAMIAQGEFVDLLRTKSDDRKKIFRRLFGTEIYNDIAVELNERLKRKYAGIATVKTEYRTYSGSVICPPDIGCFGELTEIRERFSSDKDIRVTDMERFAELLQPLCSELDERHRAAEKSCAAAAEERDKRRDAYNSAAELEKHFASLDSAKAQLAECRNAAEDIESKEALAERISRAYTVKGAYRLLEQAANAAAQTRKDLAAENDRLPALEESCGAAESAERASKEAAAETAAEAARVKEQADAALKRLAAAKQTADEIGVMQGRIKRAERAVADADREIAAHAEHIGRLRERSAELEAQTEQLEVMERNSSSLENAEAQLVQAKTAAAETEKQRREAETAAARYCEARDRHEAADSEYRKLKKIYLDNQAGYLAAELLREGSPCPVCGSVEHPDICTPPEGYGSLTQDEVNRLERLAAELDRTREQLSKQSSEAAAVLNARRGQLAEMTGRLSEQLRKIFKSVNGELSLEKAEEKITSARAALDKRLAELRAGAAELKEIRAELDGSDDEIRRLNKKRSELADAAAAANAKLEKLRGERDTLERELAYPDERSAKDALEKAEASRQKAEREHAAALGRLKRARTDRDSCNALISKHTAELPERETAERERRAEYLSALGESGLTEEEWKQTVAAFPAERTAELAAEVSAYKEKLSRAQTAFELSTKHIAGRERPDAERLRAEYEQAERRSKELADKRDDLKNMLGTDSSVLARVQSKLEERSRLSREYAVLHGLYARLTDRELDLEAYVQRRYLEQVLAAANLRFLEMTGGELELRICGDDFMSSADGRKRHGLEIMAYSTVNGKQREVSTLSGGETFMAALSLALGMADRIREQSAAVSLDILFIDEGFGSLSDNARAQAVRILKRMAGGSKLIGLISHVNELKQEIDDQLIVTKTERGSDARWAE